ncbi:MAG: DUF4091 domain-containing protein [Anaeromyxobacteraceae bacterium]
MRPSALAALGPCLACLLATTSCVPAAAAAPRAGAGVGVATSLEKLRPDDPLPAGRAITLAAARGECEAAQVAVRAGARPVALSAAAAPLAGPGRLEVTLYRVATIRLARGSGPEGEPGEWPDPLVPARDPYFGEARRAFPVRLEPGRLGAVWVEVCVPAAARPGGYAGEVVLTDGDAPLARVPVRVRVWPFALPPTPTFVAAAGLSTRLGTRALGAPDDVAVARALAAAALRHRLSPYVLSADPPWGDCTAARCALDWTPLDAELAPVLDGTLVPGVRGGFAEVRIPGKVWDGPEADLAATLLAWRRHFEARGWADRLWLYVLDEPRPSDLPELRRRARLAHAAGIRVFVTAPPTPALAAVVDAWAPQERLATAAGPGAASFSYTSCYSHGCDELPAGGRVRAAMQKEFSGWPGYVIDRPGTAARAVTWLGVVRGLSGSLYYDMLQAWTRDPWRDPRAFAGNGDGTLLYPGRPDALGGEHPFPVESIRLKVIRDALEDAELLALAREAGLSAEVDAALARLVPSARGWERRPGPWLAERAALADALAARTAR